MVNRVASSKPNTPHYREATYPEHVTRFLLFAVSVILVHSSEVAATVEMDNTNIIHMIINQLRFFFLHAF